MSAGEEKCCQWRLQGPVQLYNIHRKNPCIFFPILSIPGDLAILFGLGTTSLVPLGLLSLYFLNGLTLSKALLVNAYPETVHFAWVDPFSIHYNAEGRYYHFTNGGTKGHEGKELQRSQSS